MTTSRSESDRVRPAFAFRAALSSALYLVVVLAPATARAQDSCPEWTRGLFASQGLDRGANALLAWDDGSGPAVFAGGAFTDAGSVAASRVAKWNGSEWRALGAGVNGEVSALAVFDDGRGPALYAGGSFDLAGETAAQNVARWDGVAWSAVGMGTDGAVLALAVFDDGRGPALYAGGDFTLAGGAPANYVARWDGAAWTPLGAGIGMPQGSQIVQALAVHDDGSGPSLFVGGAFLQAGGAQANRLARWDGAAWWPVGGGLNGTVAALVPFDDGSGIALYAGGTFTSAIPPLPLNRVARWNGSAFSAVGTGFAEGVRELHVHDDGSGPRLFAAGDFSVTPVGTLVAHVARWTGGAWASLRTGTDLAVWSLTTFDDGTGPRLYASGAFRRAGDVTAESIATWDGTVWRGLRPGGVAGSVRAIAAFDGGSGPALHVGGTFQSAGGAEANRIARWNGSAWSPLGPGLDGTVNALVVHDDGSGRALYAGGDFAVTGTTRVNYVARWDGSSWTALASGLPSAVMALAVFDDGTGPALYAGGTFVSQIGSIRGIARWDGTAWTEVGGGVEGVVRTLSVHDDGTRRLLVAGGLFGLAGTLSVANVAAFDGTTWSAFGSGLSGTVLATATFDDGTGPALYAAGSFIASRRGSASRIARWDGAAWQPLLTGPNNTVRALAVFDDGTGRALFLAGDFTGVGGVGGVRIAKWNGASFSRLGAGLDGVGFALGVLPASEGFGLYAGGDFERAGGISSSHVARWIDPCAACRGGNVDARSGQAADVLFVNDSAGGGARRVILTTFAPLTIFVNAPPAAAGSAPFALYAWGGAVDASGRRTLPLGLGSTCMPTPLSGGSPKLRAVWNNTGKLPLGAPTLPSSPAPSVVLSRPGGVGRIATFYLQGIIADPNAIGQRPASVTNGIAVEIR